MLRKGKSVNWVLSGCKIVLNGARRLGKENDSDRARR